MIEALRADPLNLAMGAAAAFENIGDAGPAEVLGGVLENEELVPKDLNLDRLCSTQFSAFSP